MLRSLIRDRKPDPNPKARAIFLYETYLAEYFMLIADIEVGIVNWNKFRLAAFRVKKISEIHHFLMYEHLRNIEITQNAYVYKWNYKF